MIISVLGYFVMGLMFLVVRSFYHALSKKSSSQLVSAVKKDFANLCAYVGQIISSNPTKIKIIAAIMTADVILMMLPLNAETAYTLDVAMFAVIYFLMVIIFLPEEDPSHKGFPVEIFGFIYSIAMMYGNAGELVLEIFSTNDLFHADMWIYGYSVTLISYTICIATLSRFMERNLSRLEVIFVGMIMMTLLEFLTYYGIGFSGGMDSYNLQVFESSILEGIATIINQGIFIASQSQILERSTKEILGYIILNGTDALTVTAVLGYVLQKFMGTDHDAK